MSVNTWPNGRRHAMTQDQHREWNASVHPGTMQMCVNCDSATGRCEEDALYLDENGEQGPLCEECYDISKTKETP